MKAISLSKSHVLTLTFVSSILSASGQALLPSDYHAVKNVPSPTTASLGRYGDVPVDYFTGTPNISIPLTSISYDGITVPISLSYHSSGIRVADQPGWAGLGWDVVSGGCISRKVNWFPDEYYNRNPNSPMDYGFYFRGAALDVSDWNTPSKMLTFMPPDNNGVTNLPDGEPDEFNFNFGGYSGSFYRSEKGQWKVKSKQDVVLEISNEIDNSGNYTLYPCFDANGNPMDEIASGANDRQERVASLFTKFTITTPDGLKYEFGGTRHSIEFSRGQINCTIGNSACANPSGDRRNEIVANSWYLTKITNPNGSSIVFNYTRGRVVFQKQRSIGLSYDLQSLDGQGFSGNSPAEPNSSGTAINPSILKSIETPLQKIEFKTSKAIELGTEQTVVQPSGSMTLPFYFNTELIKNWRDLYYATDQFAANPPMYIFNEQLDSILVFDKTSFSYKNGIKFYQRSNPDKRRTLDSIGIFDWAGNNSKYRFAYSNVDDLPFFESNRTDHWGYFNGGVEPIVGPVPNKTPDPGLCLYGLINSITYPTGGYTQFEFEPAVYSSVVTVDPDNTTQPVSLTPENGIAGIRIKKVTSAANYNSPPLVTEYLYNQNYANGSGASSGILSAKPRYTDLIEFKNQGDATGSFPCGGKFRLSNTINSNAEWVGQVKGGIVAYSEVTKKEADGSYTVFKYTNNDNPVYRDEIQAGFLHYNPGGQRLLYNKNYRISSNDLERGKILSEQLYKNNGEKVKEVLYTYRNDPNRKNEFVKSFAKKILGGAQGNCASGLLGGMRAWAYKIYCYNNPLSKVTETTYESSGPVVQTKIFEYDNYGNTTKATAFGSDGLATTVATKFNSHPDYLGTATGLEATYLKKLFTNFAIKNYPVEILTLTSPQPITGVHTSASDEKITKGSVFIYDQFNPRVRKVFSLEIDQPFAYLSYNSSLQPVYNFTFSKIENGNFVYDNRYKLQTTINSFSSTPPGTTFQPISITDKINGNEIITWDHLGQYQTSVTKNATTRDVAFSSFEGIYLGTTTLDDNKGNWLFTPSMLAIGGFTGDKSFLLSSNNLVTRYNLPTGKKFILNFWLKGNSPRIMLGSTVQPVMYAPLKTAGDWQYYSIPITGTTAQLSILPGNGSSFSTQIDEVRLFPVEALMNSYTYDPLTGNLRSKSDEKGNVNFYKYDNLGRLILVTDEKGNIINNYSYQIQGPQ